MRIRLFVAAASVMAVVLTGCSGGDGDGVSATGDRAGSDAPDLDGEAIRTKLVDAGWECGDFGPYEPSGDEMDIGVEPTEMLECTDGGNTASVIGFESSTEVEVLAGLIAGFSCGFEEDPEPQLITVDRWGVGVEDAEGEEAGKLLDEVGEAIGVAPAPMDCPEDEGPGDADSNGSDDSDGTTRGSREAPLEFGQAHEVGDGWTVEVGAFEPDATAELIAEDEYGFSVNDAPEDGHRYVVVTPEATWNGEQESAEPYDVSFSVVGATGVSIDPGGCSPPDPSWMSLGEVFQGSTLVGNLCFEVPEDDVDSLVLIVEPTLAFSGNRAFLALS